MDWRRQLYAIGVANTVTLLERLIASIERLKASFQAADLEPFQSVDDFA